MDPFTVGLVLGVVALVVAARSSSSADGGGSGLQTRPTRSPIGGDPSTVSWWTDSDFRQLAEVARANRQSPADLLLVLASESGLDPTAKNPRDSDTPTAIGLNQLTKVADGVVGITEDQRLDLASWSVSEQLPLVRKFFAYLPWTKDGRAYDNAGTIYQGNFAYATMYGRGTSPDTVLYRKGVDGAAYDRNSGLDVDKKGTITVGDMLRRLSTVARGALYRGALARLRAATGDDSLAPNLVGY